MATPVITGIRSPSMEIGRNDVQIFQIAEVAGAVLALGRRIVFRHVLREDVARRNALHQQRADVADHRREPVFFLERVRRADRNGFLAEAASTDRRRFCSGGTASPSCLRPRGSAACSSTGRDIAARVSVFLHSRSADRPAAARNQSCAAGTFMLNAGNA